MAESQKLTVKAWKTTVQKGPEPETSVAFLLYEGEDRIGQTWVLPLERAEAVFGKEAVATIPLLPDMKDAALVELTLKVL